MKPEDSDYNMGYAHGFEAAMSKLEERDADVPMSEEDQFNAALEAARACCPEGWRVVPVMPTTEMINAFANYIKDWYGRPVDYQRGADAWARILAASPAAGEKPE